MSCRSALYVNNPNDQVIAVDGQIGLGNIVRRFGNNITLDNNAVRIAGSGYYDVDAMFTVEGTAAGTAIITLYKDGVAVPGATASASLAVGDVVTIGIDALVREMCYDSMSSLTFVLTGIGATVTNATAVVEKI